MTDLHPRPEPRGEFLPPSAAATRKLLSVGALELAGVPTASVFPLGSLWLALGSEVVLGVILGDERHPYLLLLLSLVIFSPPSRVPVFATGGIETTWAVGTHYGGFESWQQALFSQLLWGSAIQVIPGFLIGSAALDIKRLGS